MQGRREVNPSPIWGTLGPRPLFPSPLLSPSLGSQVPVMWHSSPGSGGILWSSAFESVMTAVATSEGPFSPWS